MVRSVYAKTNKARILWGLRPSAGIHVRRVDSELGERLNLIPGFWVPDEVGRQYLLPMCLMKAATSGIPR
jgi:hypothetical protein